MKTRLFLPLALIASASLAKAAVTINFAAGQLLLDDGITAIPDTALIQLVADTQGDGFTAPTANSLTGGSSDDLILASFSLSETKVGAGSFSSALITPLSGNLNSGDRLILRWFPTLTASYTSSDTISGYNYGQFRTDTANADGSDSAWIIPGDGLTISLYFLPASGINSPGAASYVVTAVPEPSTYGLVGAGALAAVAAVRRRRKR